MKSGLNRFSSFQFYCYTKEVAYRMHLLDLVHSFRVEHAEETWCLPYRIFIDAVLMSTTTNFDVEKFPWLSLAFQL